MKKTHWLKTTLLTLVACGIAGLILAVILFNANPERTGASSSIEFSFKGAAEGVAPNGLRYDLGGFTSDEVLNAALQSAGMEGKYTAAQLKENLIVSGVYPKNIVEQMTRYESILQGDAGRVAAADYHATLYNVTLYNDFDKSISKADLEKLLGSIMTEFRARFEKTYSVFLAKDSLIDNLSDYDYAQQLELLEGSIVRYENFAAQMAREHAEFLQDGEGFVDIAARYTDLRVSDLERLSGIVTMNALSKDQERIVAQYENQIKVLTIRLTEMTQEAKDTENLINQYSKDDIIYVSTAEALQQISGASAQTYDELVRRRVDIEENIAATNKELAEIQLKLKDIQGEKAAATENGEEAENTNETAQTAMVSEEDRQARVAVVEKGISNAVNKLNAVTEDFTAFLKAYSEQEMNDRTVAVTAVKYNAPKLLSGSFIKMALKTAGPICAVGFMICLIGIIISRRKEEKTGKA
ncbi:MAG: hypothetical protein IKG87_03705 [Clostridia bacterium]|nr:hypothetical protein [Clostridia bacterium]